MHLTEVLKGGSYVTPSAAEGLTNISLRDPKDRDHVPNRLLGSVRSFSSWRKDDP